MKRRGYVTVSALLFLVLLFCPLDSKAQFGYGGGIFLEKVSGDKQLIQTREKCADLIVRARDGGGSPITDTVISFNIYKNGKFSLGPYFIKTDEDGVAHYNPCFLAEKGRGKYKVIASLERTSTVFNLTVNNSFIVRLITDIFLEILPSFTPIALFRLLFKI